MNLRSLAFLACRILAIVALISVIQASSPLLLLLYQAFNPYTFGPANPLLGYVALPFTLALIYLLPVVLLCIAAFILWIKAELIATKFVVKGDAELPIAIDARVEALAFSILGAYVLTGALPKLSQMLIKSWVVSRVDYLTHQDWTGLGAPNFSFVFVQIVLGLWLLLGARGFVATLRNARNLGRDAELQSEENDDEEIPPRPEK